MAIHCPAVVLDGDNKIGTMAESIICSERLDAYKFVVLAAFEMAKAKKRKKKSYLVMALWVTDFWKILALQIHVSSAMMSII